MINWGKLYSQGRVKDIGVSWDPDETKAIYELKIPVEYVRSGIKTLEAYNKALEKELRDGKPLERIGRDKLIAKAKKLGIDFTPDITEDVLVKLIKKVEKQNKEAEKNAQLVSDALQANAEEEARTKALASELVKDQSEAIKEEKLGSKEKKPLQKHQDQKGGDKK